MRRRRRLFWRSKTNLLADMTADSDGTGAADPKASADVLNEARRFWVGHIGGQRMRVRRATGTIRCRRRVGGILNFYYRSAA
jgi:hypothetical protein